MKKFERCKMKIKVKMEASEDRRQITISLDDLDMSVKEWECMSENARKDAIQDYINDLPEHPYWIIDTYNETD